MQLSMFSLEEHPVNPSPSPAAVSAWMIRVATWPSDFFSLLAQYAPVGCFGKTSLVSVPRGPAQIRPVIWSRDSDGNLQKQVISDASWKPWGNSGMGSPTEVLTLNTSTWPSDASGCSLLDVLETGDVPQRYFLSAKACAGILRRADRRGRELPTALREALAAVMENTTPTEKIASRAN